VQQINVVANEEFSQLDSPQVLIERLQSVNHLWADLARKLGKQGCKATVTGVCVT